MQFALCSKISNFFLKTNFLDRSKAKNPSCERDTFIFRVFYDRSNSGKSFSKKCMSSKFALHTSTNFQNVIQDAVHVFYYQILRDRETDVFLRGVSLF